MLLPLQGERNTLGIIPQGDALGYVLLALQAVSTSDWHTPETEIK